MKTQNATIYISTKDHFKSGEDFDLVLDAEREAKPTWYQDHKMLGGVCYVDLFANDLDGIHKKIPYFKELGLTYLHLMPLFRSPEGPVRWPH